MAKIESAAQAELEKWKREHMAFPFLITKVTSGNFSSRPALQNSTGNQHLPRKIKTHNDRNCIRKRLRKLVHPDQRIGDHKQHCAEPQQAGPVLDPARHERTDIETP